MELACEAVRIEKEVPQSYVWFYAIQAFGASKRLSFRFQGSRNLSSLSVDRAEWQH